MKKLAMQTGKEEQSPPSIIEEYDYVSTITASDADIEAAVAQANLPALLATLAMLTKDENLISDELKPPSPKMTSTIAPQGGMSPNAQEIAKKLALQKIIEYRDAGCPAPSLPSSEQLDKIMHFLIRKDHEGCMPLLRHELNIPVDVGAPDWTINEIAPNKQFKVAVIGAGVSGIAAAYRLQQAGIDFKVFEKATEVGGVWWANRYPGCRLDTPNYAYSLSFAQKTDWPQEFSRQPEIQNYLQQVTKLASLRSYIQFETEVESMSYEDSSALWTVTTRTKDGLVKTQQFNAIVTAVGILSRPMIPAFKGIDNFEGQIVHSAEWPEKLDLKDKRVALIGTGASAFQIGPSIINHVKSLAVFQRNPPWMLPTPNYHDDIKPGMTWLLKHIPYYGRWFRFWQFWIAVEGRLPLLEVDPDWKHPVSVSQANEQLRQECLTALEKQYIDRPDLLKKVVPTYPPGAKRMLRDNGVWANMLKQKNVTLVTDSISYLTNNSITTEDGVNYPVDVIICATGFKSADFLAPIKITGRNGINLHKWWNGDCRAYIGITVPGFPNLFMTGGPNTAVVINGSAIFSSECQVEYILKALKLLLTSEARALDCKQEPFEKYNREIDEGNKTKAWGVGRTNSWYVNAAGRASQSWPLGLLDYWTLTAKVKAEDYEFLP